MFVRHARTARTALDNAFTVLELPAPSPDQAAGGHQDGPAPAGRGKRVQVHGQQSLPEAPLTAFQNACGAGAGDQLCPWPVPGVGGRA
ncbi:hypothetical protein ACFY4B_36875 [Kitasatospora sp. NPDC001261]|uniref:hypothetical protein n=1 Tax=Kitasatospora sp. NPDC001261 TaxID=3364012 RepID=UPI0036BC3E05